MNALQKFSVAASTAVLALGVSAGSASAASINRADFGVDAINYGFENTSVSATSVTSGNLTVTNGFVTTASLATLISPNYYDGADPSPITLFFANPVSAVGLDWFSNNANPTLSVFDSSNTLIESLTLNFTSFPRVLGFPTGFIGLNVGTNSISKVIIDTPLNGNELYVDNIVYQSARPVPVPGAVFGVIVAGGALVARQRKNAKAKQTVA